MNDESTRARVVDAAIECILDEGFYRASSNKIAKRAGVTWGVIQYHFGTREALMLAVHERGLHELDGALADAVIEGDSVEARLASFVDALWAYYRRPEFLAYMQVVLNLSHDPTTADSTRLALKSSHDQVGERLPAMGRAVLGDGPSDAQVVETLALPLQRRARPRARPGAARRHAGGALGRRRVRRPTRRAGACACRVVAALSRISHDVGEIGGALRTSNIVGMESLTRRCGWMPKSVSLRHHLDFSRPSERRDDRGRRRMTATARPGFTPAISDADARTRRVNAPERASCVLWLMGSKYYVAV